MVYLGVMTMAVPARAQGQGMDATIASVKTTYDVAKGYVLKAAAQVPEDKYAYQPTKEVRTMGQLFGHIADASAMICATATGQKPGAGGAEKITAKAELQKALAAAFAACDKAIGSVTTANANESVGLFGMTHTRVGALAFNTAHIFEHYGNLVTYMRLNNMVPPSSQGN
jgi:uncharacterized damage-inducible protein DinB